MATARSATVARMVSTETSTPSAARPRTTGRTRRSSSSSSTRGAPGRVDSPPTSTMSAPVATRSMPCLIAAAESNQRPPSEKESGVTLTTPMTAQRPKSRSPATCPLRTSVIPPAYAPSAHPVPAGRRGLSRGGVGCGRAAGVRRADRPGASAPGRCQRARLPLGGRAGYVGVPWVPGYVGPRARVRGRAAFGGQARQGTGFTDSGSP